MPVKLKKTFINLRMRDVKKKCFVLDREEPYSFGECLQMAT